MNKLYIEEIQDFLDLVNFGYFENVNIFKDNFLEYNNKYWRYKNLAKILHLRHLDKKLNKSIYDEFNDKIEHLKHIQDEYQYYINVTKFIDNNLEVLGNKIDNFLKFN